VRGDGAVQSAIHLHIDKANRSNDQKSKAPLTRGFPVFIKKHSFAPVHRKNGKIELEGFVELFTALEHPKSELR